MTNTSAAAGEQQNLLALYQQGGGVQLDLLANVAIRWLCATLGALSNFSLVFVTAKSKNLRSACNLLIALDSLYAGFYELSVTNTFLVVFSGLQFIPLGACLRLQLLPLAGFFLSQGGMLFIALDRLLCVLAPVWVLKNQRRHIRLLVPLMALLGALYAAYALALCIGISLSHGEKLVQCGTGDCYPGDVGNVLNRNQLIILALTVLCYPAIFALLFYRQRDGTAQGPTMRYNQRIAKSLVAIVLVLLGSQALGALARIFGLRPSSATSTTTFLLANGQVCLNYLAYGCNAPILFCLSVEYRKAFKAVFLANSNNQVHVQSTGQQQQWQSYNRMGGTGNNAINGSGQAGIGGR